MHVATGSLLLRMAAKITRRVGEAVAKVLEQEAKDLQRHGWPIFEQHRSDKDT